MKQHHKISRHRTKASHRRSTWVVDGLTKRQYRRLPDGIDKAFTKVNSVFKSLKVR